MNEGGKMLTTASILETLDKKEFPSYKSLLSSVASFWETHAGRLPAEIGPRDIVAKAASMRMIKRNANGTIIVVSPKRIKKSGSTSKSGSSLARKRAAASRSAL
jgi:hypothetical protein